MLRVAIIKDAAGAVREGMSRLRLRRSPSEGARKPSGFMQMPTAGRFFVVGVILTAAVSMILAGPRQIPDLGVFVALLLASSLASGLKLRLPLGTSASNLSISYTFDFAALILLGTPPATVVAGISAWTQSQF